MQVQIQVPLLKPAYVEKSPQNLAALITEEVEELWKEVLSSNLFSYEQMIGLDNWKKEFFNKHVGQETASLALFSLYKKYFLPYQGQPEIDWIICSLKLIMGLILPLDEDVESFIHRNLAYCDEKAAPVIQFQVQTLMAITALYEEQTTQLCQVVQANQQQMTQSLLELKSGLDAYKLQSQSTFTKLDEIQRELDKRLEKSHEQDKTLKTYADELHVLQSKKINLLNQVNQITKGY